MNTVEKGDLFEDKAYELLQKAIEDEDLAIPFNRARVYKKHKYYSKTRGRDIIFDLAIEVWPKNAKNFSLLYLIECKDYSTKKVPIGDIELFARRVSDVAELNGKAIFMAKCAYPDSAIDFAENTGMCLIHVSEDSELDIILHRQVNNSYEEDFDIDKLIQVAFNSKISGLKVLSKTQISGIVAELLQELKPSVFKNYDRVEICDLVSYFRNKFSLEFNFEIDLSEKFGESVLGCFDSQENTIYIDKSLNNDNRFLFTLGHEIGHFYLHRNLKVNQVKYNSFKDSNYNLFEGRHILQNPKHWIEWQANCFAVNLVLPESAFRMQLQAFLLSIGLKKYQYIYLDEQPTNQKDFLDALDYLSGFFGVSKQSVEIRMEELKLLMRVKKKDAYRDALRGVVRLD